MGLNAIVYKNAGLLQEKYGKSAFEFDAFTGELTPKPDARIIEPRTSYVAIARRLGNFDAITHLRSEITKLLDGDESVILRKVLHSATHTGDRIESADFPKIEVELKRLKNYQIDRQLATFVADFDELIEIAQREANPIVFV